MAKDFVSEVVAARTQKNPTFPKMVKRAQTVAAMKEARRGGLRSFGSVPELMDDLEGKRPAKPPRRLQDTRKPVR